MFLSILVFQSIKGSGWVEMWESGGIQTYEQTAVIHKTFSKKLPKPQSTVFALELVPFPPGTPKWPFRTVPAHLSPLDLQYSSA